MKTSRFVAVIAVVAVLLLRQLGAYVSPAARTWQMAAAILLWLIVGILLLVKKERRKPAAAAYIVVACAIAATAWGTFGQVTPAELVLRDSQETITRVSLRVRDGQSSWEWVPSEGEPALSGEEEHWIEGGSASELLRGLGEVSLRNYRLGPSRTETELDDLTIFTSAGNSIYLHGSDGVFTVRVNGDNLRGKWEFTAPISDYLPRQVLEWACS